MKSLTTAVAVALGLLLLSSPLGAQEPADRPPARTTDPPADQPPLAQRVRRYVENNRVVRGLSDDGFYPLIGGLITDSGLAGGAGYRRHVLNGVYADVSGAVSTRAYVGVDARVRWLQTANRKLELWTEFRYRHDPEDDFYGIGNDSSLAANIDFGLDSIDLVTRVVGRVRPGLRLGADIGYFSPDIRRARTEENSIEHTFTEITAPGLDRQPKFLHEGVFAELDSRDAPGFPRRGGVYRATVSLWDDRTFNQYDVRRFDIDGSQFFGVTPKDVVALRLGLSYANNKPGAVPFYMLPFLGGGTTLRAFREFRFRDENAGVFNAEFRHQVHSMVHVAAFVDAGKVAHDWRDINLAHLRHGYGWGVRAGTQKRMFLRFDVGYGGGEGARMFLKVGPAF